jgi:GT2 family glycosyltransferase
MNGNCVLIPRAVATGVGNLDSAFVHVMGDFDYGLRARTAGFGIWVLPGFAGICDKNSLAGTFFDRSLAVPERWRRMQSPKGLPPAEWKIFCRRHAGSLWMLYFFWPYLRMVFPQLPGSTKRPELESTK